MNIQLGDIVLCKYRKNRTGRFLVIKTNSGGTSFWGIIIVNALDKKQNRDNTLHFDDSSYAILDTRYSLQIEDIIGIEPGLDERLTRRIFERNEKIVNGKDSRQKSIIQRKESMKKKKSKKNGEPNYGATFKTFNYCKGGCSSKATPSAYSVFSSGGMVRPK